MSKIEQRTRVGDKFGHLTVIECIGKKSERDNHYLSKVRCDCGNEFVTRDTFLICGSRTQCPQCSNLKGQKHGMTDSPLFWCWQGMKDRCYNSKCAQYKNYGGRGIKVCDEWLENSSSFIEWGLKNGWKQGVVIARKNIDGNYCPDNCFFTDRQTLAHNKRNTLKIHYEGQLLSIDEVAEITGISHQLIYQRITRNHWSEYDATHVIPDTYCYHSKIMRRTCVTDMNTGEQKMFDSTARASRYIGVKPTYLVSRSYTLGNKFTHKHYLIEIEDKKNVRR